MGCVSSNLLNHDEKFSQIGGSTAFSHHIVSLTSTTYGLLTLDPPTTPPPRPAQQDPTTAAGATVQSPPPPPPRPAQQDSITPTATATPQSPLLPRITLASLLPSQLSEPPSLRYQNLETINSWDLMSGLDSDQVPSFRCVPSKISNTPLSNQENNENVIPNIGNFLKQSSISQDLSTYLERFEKSCPPNGENKVVLYTTSLRGVRKTFEDCNTVRSAIQGLGIMVCERDISMDRGFRDELRGLMKGKGSNELMVPPRLFVKGRYIGGVDEVMKIVEEGYIAKLIQGCPQLREGYVNLCEGCGGLGFLPCFTCHGSCKMVVGLMKQGKKSVVVSCCDCNENGLVLCPICY